MFLGMNDGSTEAAMTLLAMRDPAFQLNISIQGMMCTAGLNCIVVPLKPS